jgi:hypothetical protein
LLTHIDRACQPVRARVPGAGPRFLITPRIPRRISTGRGGQPAITASTAITLATLPQLA